MKKIAILFSGSRIAGGIDQYLINLFKYYPKEEASLVLLSLGDWRLTELIKNEGGEVQVFSGSRFRIRTILEIAHYLKAEKIAVLTSGGVVANAYARAASFISRVPSVVIVHSFIKDEYRGIHLCLYLLADRISRFRTKKYIAVSNNLKQELIKSGIKAQKIAVIYNGVDFQPVKGSASRKKIGSIGRLVTLKGYKNLIQAMQKLPKEVTLTIWGEGPEQPELEALVNRLNLSARVALAGKTERVWEDLTKIGLYVQPSLSEGFGLTTVEAMGAGLPVIVTPVGGLKEIVTNQETGIIAPGTTPDSLVLAIEEALKDEKSLEKLGSNGQAFVQKKFEVVSWAQKTVKYLKEV